MFLGLKGDRSKCPGLQKRIGQLSWSNKMNRSFQNYRERPHFLELCFAKRELTSDHILQVTKEKSKEVLPRQVTKLV